MPENEKVTEVEKASELEADIESFAFRGYSFLIEKLPTGQLRIFRKTKKGIVEIYGQKAYGVARAYKLKVEKEPSLRRPRSFAKKPKKRFK